MSVVTTLLPDIENYLARIRAVQSAYDDTVSIALDPSRPRSLPFWANVMASAQTTRKSSEQRQIVFRLTMYLMRATEGSGYDGDLEAQLLTDAALIPPHFERYQDFVVDTFTEKQPGMYGTAQLQSNGRFSGGLATGGTAVGTGYTLTWTHLYKVVPGA